MSARWLASVDLVIVGKEFLDVAAIICAYDTGICLVLMDRSWIAALVILMISSVGLICNMIVLIFSRKVTTLKNAFGRLSSSQAAAEAIFCATFLFYYTPMVFFDDLVMVEQSNYAGMLISTSYSICTLSHLLIGLNRMCAICFPMKYGKIFSFKNDLILLIKISNCYHERVIVSSTRKDYAFSNGNTNIMIAIIWASSVILILFINLYVECRFVYLSLLNAFVFVTDEGSEFDARRFYFTKNFGTLVLTIAVDFITILAVRNTSKKLATKSREFHVRRSRELNLLKQAVAQAAAFAAQIFSLSWLAWQFDSGWAIWSFTVVAWNLLHLIDPVIIIACNKEFRRLIFSLKVPTQPLKSTTSIHAVFHTRQSTF